MAKNYLDKDGLLYLWTQIKGKFVGKDGDKVLSDNNFTDELKTKLEGIENNANKYTLPKATSDTLGGVKVGSGLESADDGTISVKSGGKADSVDWSGVQGKPTTIAGYGITDAKISDKTITIGSNSVEVPSALGDLENNKQYQTKSEVSTAITNATKDLAKTSDVTSKITEATTDMATKSYVTSQLANINKKEVVTSTSAMTDANTIYLMSNSGSGNNIYDEYIVVNNKPEKIGTTEVDLSGYLKESDFTAISNQDIESILAQ